MNTPPLDVLVPRGRDPFVDYALGPPGPDAGGHPPVNFHAMAAATGGRFHRRLRTIPGGAGHVLLLLPRRLPRAYLAALALKRGGRKILVSWKECGAHQIARQAGRPLAEFWLRRTLALADAVLCASPAALAFFAARPEAGKILTLPTPYPLDEPGWPLGGALSARAGIFVGTRDWQEPTRRHEEAVRIALCAAERSGCRVSAVNVDGPAGRRRYEALGAGESFRVVEGPLPYAAYLREMAGHRIALQRDRSGVPGQVAGDALLCGIPCLGGDGMVDRIAFADLPDAEAKDDDVLAAALGLLGDDATWTRAMRSARARADASLSFAAFRRTWRDLSASLGGLTGRRGPA